MYDPSAHRELTCEPLASEDMRLVEQRDKIAALDRGSNPRLAPWRNRFARHAANAECFGFEYLPHRFR
jgi:hypothetical protein